jgi:hypothetical protein
MLNKIIESSKYVCEKAKYVSINYENINLLTNELLSMKNEHYFNKIPIRIIDKNIKDIVNFLLIYDAIDYSFWGKPKWSIRTEFGNLDGGMALLYKIFSLFSNKDSKEVYKDLENMSFAEFSKLLAGNDIAIPLLKERYETVTSIAKIVNSKMNGNFYEVVRNMHNDTELFNFIIDNFTSFKDERTYKNEKIYFYKLAQLLTSDILHMMKEKENIKVDYSHLIGCADYKIPQVLRGLDIIEYSNELAKIVDNEEQIPEDSEYEVEIRATMLVVIDYIYNLLDRKIARIDINDFIWLKSKDKMLVLKPYHLTRTTSY